MSWNVEGATGTRECTGWSPDKSERGTGTGVRDGNYVDREE
jgi:hypothetical protein